MLVLSVVLVGYQSGFGLIMSTKRRNFFLYLLWPSLMIVDGGWYAVYKIVGFVSYIFFLRREAWRCKSIVTR